MNPLHGMSGSEFVTVALSLATLAAGLILLLKRPRRVKIRGFKWDQAKMREGEGRN